MQLCRPLSDCPTVLLIFFDLKISSGFFQGLQYVGFSAHRVDAPQILITIQNHAAQT